MVSTLFAAVLCAQDKNLKFDYLNAAQGGLSTNRILSIYRDTKGFLWVGTQAGVNRCDGYSTKVFTHDTLNPRSLAHNIVLNIYEDSQQRLWMATQNGLCLFNPLSEDFDIIHFTEPGENINNREVYAVCEDKTNSIWAALGKNGGIALIDSDHKTYQRIRIGDFHEEIAFNSVTDIKPGNDNTLWLSTLGNGLVSFNPDSKKFRIISDPDIDMGTGTIKRLYQSPDGNIWIMTEGKGLFRYSPVQQTFYKIPVRNDGTGINGASVRSMVQFDKDHLFIGVDHGGINALNLKTGRFNYIQYNELSPRTLANDGVWSMFMDNEGILWVGTSAAGISFYNPKKERFNLFSHSADPHSLSYNAILCFYEDADGKIWIGTDGGGLSIFDPRHGSFETYRHDPRNPSGIGSNVILSIDGDKEGNIWMGTWNDGLLKYNKKTKTFHQYLTSENNKATIGSNNIWSVKTDTLNNLWISNYDYGIDVYNRKGFRRIFRYDPVKQVQDTFFNINVFYRGFHDRLWIARGKFISFVDTSANELKNHIRLAHKATSVFCMYEDNHENLWIGTNTKGILCYDRYGKIILTLNNQNGLPNNTVFAILEDNSGNLWITTDDGICRYNKLTGAFKNYPQNDPVQRNHYKEWAYLKARDGTFYFGGYNGFNTFNPDNIKENIDEPYVYLSDFQIFSKSVRIGEYDSMLTRSIKETKKIVIPHKLSVFSLAFTAVTFTNPENITYQYKLDGFEEDWNTRDASRRYVTYTNLDHGKYFFRVKASNNDGVWSKQETYLEIVILPPWWKTWWFRILASLLIIFCSIYLYRKSLNRIRTKNELLEKTVRERTKELSQQNKEIEAQKVQLEEKNKLLQEHEYEMEVQNEELQSQAEELLTQSEELQNQANALVEYNDKIQRQHRELEAAYSELSKYRTHLEGLVDERTRELIIAKEKAEESDRLKSSFLANLSHEIRTPLNAIIGFSSLLSEDDMEPEERQGSIDIILRSNDMLLSLINDIVDFSKIEAGQLVIHLADVPVGKIVNQVHDIFKLETRKQMDEERDHITYSVVAPEQILNRVMHTDEVRLMQIISNLISNAIKYTPQGKVEFGCRSDAEGKFMEFYVKDTGIGIKKEHHDIIFHRFRKIEDNTTKLYRGAGLGLAITSELINLLGGSIKVESEMGKGSIFTINIPLQNESMLSENAPLVLHDSGYPNFSMYNILVVEDDISSYLYLERLLKKTGAHILHAENGKQAVDIAGRNTTLHAILMDIKMPEMDGLEALKRIRKNNKVIPVVAQTAFALSDEIITIKKAGFDSYITKPLKASELFNCLTEILQGGN